MDEWPTNGASLDSGHMDLQALQVQFLERLPVRLDEIRALWNSLSPGNWSDVQAEDLHRAVHSLTGTAGIFGLHDLSRAARAFEQLLHLVMQPGRVLDEVDWPALRLSQERLQAASRSPTPAEAAPANAAPVLFTREASSADPVWRVLVVDDDPMALDAHGGILEAAGMEVYRVCVAADAEQAVIEFEPDVVLLDVYMPGMSGPELAATLRQREDLLHLSILFLSAETDLTQQLLAMDLGGDGFLIKPAQPAHLVAAVAARARRSRHNRSVRRRLETTLYEREREHLALNEHAIVSVADAGGHITYVNDRYCEISGYSRDELLGRSHSMGRSGVHSREFHAHLWREVSAGRVWQGEICNRSKDGRLYWVATTITPFMDAQGQPYQYINIRTDITHLKESQAEIRRQRDMQRLVGTAAARMVGTASDNIDQAIETALRTSGERLEADRAYLLLFSRDGERVGRLQGWDAPGFEPLLSDEVNQTSPPLNHQRSWIRHDTPWLLKQVMEERLLRIHDVNKMPPAAASDCEFLKHFSVNALVLVPMLVQGRLVGLIAYTSERARPDWLAPEIDLLKVLSEVIGSALARRRAERALRESEARLHFLVSASPVTIYTCQAKSPHAVTYISPNLTRLLGHDPESFVTAPLFWRDNIHPDDRARVLRYAKDARHKRVYQQEYRFRAQDGSYRWVQDAQRMVHDASGTPTEIVGYWMDITERKRIEDELSRFNDELEHRVAAQTQTVIESERMARATLDALSSHVVILDAQGVILAANHAWSRAQPNPYKEDLVIGEGSNYLSYCEQFAHSHVVRPEALPIAQGVRAVIAGEKSEFLHEYTVFSPGKQRWYVCRVERFPGDGEVRVVVSHENVTQIKLIERQQMRSQRLESLGTLAGGVAHDLNNALAPILMGMEILKEDYPGEAKVLEMIQASARRGADMVKQLLAFAKGADGERVVLQTSRLISELENLMRGSFPKNIQLVIDNETTLPGVMGDPTQLHQVLLNLCVNARDAMPEGGTLTLRTQWVHVDAAYAQMNPDASPGAYLVLRVSDTGTGISPEVIDRIFDPFFTTKSLDKGTGLGLATVLGIIRGHKGFVQVYSQPGDGSTFAVHLPVHQMEEVETVATKEDLFRGTGEAVLFVDDEAAVREIGQAVLNRLQFRPVVAADGTQGLMLAVAHQHELRVVVTDLHMPNMDGLAFVRALRRSVPGLPVIVCSGRVDDTVATELKSLDVKVRLDKPFSEAQLSQALRVVLCNPAE